MGVRGLEGDLMVIPYAISFHVICMIAAHAVLSPASVLLALYGRRRFDNMMKRQGRSYGAVH